MDQEQGMVVFATLAFLFLLGIFFTVNIVGAGQRGVLLEFAKPIAVVPEGISFRAPLVDSIEIMNVRTLKFETNASAASKDLQDVWASVALNYHLVDSKVLDLFQTIGNNPAIEDTVISPAVQESVKATTASYDAESLITQREHVRSSIEELLRQKLADRGIIVESISITHFEFSESFSQAIEAKQVAQQNALKAQNDLVRIKTEAEQQIAIAGGQANATLTKAYAEATALKIQGDALKESSQVVSLRMIEKWNGMLPNFMVNGQGGSGFNLMMVLNQTN